MRSSYHGLQYLPCSKHWGYCPLGSEACCLQRTTTVLEYLRCFFMVFICHDAPPLTPSHAHTQIGYVYNYVCIHTICIDHILIHAVYLSPALSMSMHYILYLYTWLVSDPEVYLYDRCSHSLFLSFLRARIASTAPLTCASEKNLLVLLWQSWIEDSPLWTEIAELFHEFSLAFCFSLCVRVWQTLGHWDKKKRP